MSAPAKLPAEAREHVRRLIASLAPGESAFTLFNSMCVTKDGECFLSERGWLEREDGPFAIRVRRDEDGYHVVLPPDRKFQPEGDAPPKGWIPVASITIAGGERKGA